MGSMKFSPRDRRRSVGNKSRKLGLQSLENRALLAGDVGVEIVASDVNGDGRVSAVDALQVINALHSQSRGGVIEDLSSVDVNQDGVLSPRDALGVINHLNANRTRRVQSEPGLHDRILERLSDRDPSETLGNGAIREIAQRLAERRGEPESIEGLKELVSAARADGDVTEVERAEIRERASTELAERGRDGSNIDPERREQLRERIAARRDADVDPERREQLRERIAARRDADVDPERREQLRERIAARRDADVDPGRREQLRERIAARRGVSSAFVQIVQ